MLLVGWASRPSKKGGRDTPQICVNCVNYLIRDPYYEPFLWWVIYETSDQLTFELLKAPNPSFVKAIDNCSIAQSIHLDWDCG
jgi:hypothetical protein